MQTTASAVGALSEACLRPLSAHSAFVLAFSALFAGMQTAREFSKPMKHLSLFLAPVAFVSALPAFAANSAELDEVVVTASRTAQTSGINNAYVQIISAEEIKSSGAQTVVDVLRRAAAIQVTDTVGDGSAPQIAMRGFGTTGSQNTLVLLDGRRLNNETDIAPINLRNLSIHDIERIEIVNGSSGALYGAGAVGGIINIITKQADSNQLNISTSRGSFDSEKYHARASARKGAWSMVLNGDKELSDNYRDNNALNSSFGQLKLGYRQGPITAYVETSKQKQDIGLAGSLTDAQLSQDRRQTTSPLDYGAVDSTRLSTGGSIALNNNWQFSIDSTLRSDDITSFYAAFGGAPSLQKRDQFSINPKLTGQLHFANRASQVIVGQDIERGRYEAFGSIGKPISNSSYAQISVPISATVDITAGYRHGRHHNDISFTPKIKDSVNAGSLGVFWRATDSLKTWLRVDENYRFATIDETTFTATFLPLETQTGTSYEAGLEKQINQHTFRLQAYQLELKNEIAYDPSQGMWGANVNLDPTRRRGFTGSWNAALGSQWHADAQLAFVNATFSSGAFKGNNIPNVSRTTVTSALTYKPLDSTSIMLEGQYSGSKFADSDYTNSSKVKPVLLSNLALSQDWKAFTASVRVNNLLNEKYDAYIVNAGFGDNHYPAATRNVLFTVAYRLQ